MELLRFRLLRHMDGIGIKAKVWGEILSSNGLLRLNVIDFSKKIIKTIAIFLLFEYTICNRVARSLFGIGDQAETCAQLFYVKERFYGFEKTIDLR